MNGGGGYLGAPVSLYSVITDMFSVYLVIPLKLALVELVNNKLKRVWKEAAVA
jgi:hypothetical protein